LFSDTKFSWHEKLKPAYLKNMMTIAYREWSTASDSCQALLALHAKVSAAGGL